MNLQEFINDINILMEKSHIPAKNEVRQKILERILSGVKGIKVKYEKDGVWELTIGNVTSIGNFNKISKECISVAEQQ